MENTKYSDVPAVLFAKDLQNLGFSRSATYAMLNRSDFPAAVIGKRRCVARERFFAWMDGQTSAGGGGTFAG